MLCCFALLCFALLCFALLCFALLCFALLCFALLTLGDLKIWLVAQVLILLLFVLSALSGSEYFIQATGSILFIAISVNGVKDWYMGNPIGIRAPLEIPVNAPKYIRLLGLCFWCLIFILGLFAGIDLITT
jgi:hypothetical protein